MARVDRRRSPIRCEREPSARIEHRRVERGPPGADVFRTISDNRGFQRGRLKDNSVRCRMAHHVGIELRDLGLADGSGSGAQRQPYKGFRTATGAKLPDDARQEIGAHGQQLVREINFGQRSTACNGPSLGVDDHHIGAQRAQLLDDLA